MFHKLSLIAFFAWVGLGADGLSSSCYGPEEAFRVLREFPHLAVYVALGSAFTVIVVSTCYSQIIELFPSGGGGYLVASQLLKPWLGMISGCALIIDYTLTISLSIASGADAVFSFLPPQWYTYKIWAAILGVMVLMALNMRGVKESVVPLLPVFMIFIITHAFAILYVMVTRAAGLVDMAQNTIQESQAAAGQFGVLGFLLLVLRAYSMGAGTYTGIEAVSNGLPMLREPRALTGKRTMVYMATSLVIAVIGLMFAYVLLNVVFQEGKTLNAVMLETMTAGWSPTFGRGFVLVTLVSEAAILFVAAQTGFMGGPRVLANMAIDRWFPNRFANLSDRLVTQNGVVLMGGAALVTMAMARGSVRFLVVLYSITVFITFVLAQLGMVRHWWQCRAKHQPWKKGIAINGIGLVMTGFILVSVVYIKFGEGGWITLLVTGSLICLALTIRRHYEKARRMLRRLDTLVTASDMAVGRAASITPSGVDEKAGPQYRPETRTAVVLVNGFNGLGLHTLFSVKQLFGESFRNFAFVQVGLVDAGNFKGIAELGHLREHIESELGRYVKFMKSEGYYAEGFSALGTDVVEEVFQLVPKILERFPQSVFFGGQLVFPEDTPLTRLLHNYIVFAVQRRLYTRGIPFVILPIRI
jgi:amino acid transporter